MAYERLDIVVTDNGTTRVVKRNLEDIGKEARQAGFHVRALSSVLGVLGVGLGVSKLIEYSNAWQSIINKLDLVTKSNRELLAVNEALYQVSKRSRTSYEDVVGLYQRVALQAKQLGLSQKELVDLTETVSKAAQMANTGAKSAEQGIRQFTQAIGSGKLAGDEFRSVLENTPRLAKAIADGAGVSVGALFAMSKAGKLTSGELVQALQSQSQVINEEFLKMRPTIAQAFQVLSDGFLHFIGELEEATHIGEIFANMVITLADNMGLLVTAIVGFGAAAAVAFGPAIAAQAAELFLLFAANPFLALVAGVITLVTALVTMGDKIKVSADGTITLRDVFLDFIDQVVNAWNGFVEVLRDAGIIDAFNAIGDAISSVLEAVGQWLSDTDHLQAVMAGVAGVIATVAVVLAVPLVSALVAATGAALGFAAAILANPLTWLALLIGVVVASVVYFGNKTYEVNGKLISGWSYFKAAALGTFAAIVDGAKTLWENIKAVFSYIGNIIVYTGAAMVSAMTGNYQAAWDFGKMAAESATKGLPQLKSIGGAMGSAYTKAFNDSVANAPVATPHSVKHRGGVFDGLPGVSTEDSTPEAMPGAAGKKHNSPLSRAELMANEFKRISDEMQTTSDVAVDYLNREAFKKIDEFNKMLRGKRMPILTPDEQASMSAAVQALEDAKRVSQARDEVLRSALGPRQSYIDQEKAINQLLAARRITEEQATKAMQEAQIAFYNSQDDVASGKMLGQLEIMKQLRDQAHPVADAMKRMFTDAVGPTQQYTAALEALEALSEQHLLTTEQQAQAMRNLRMEFLQTQTDFASGLELGQLQTQKDRLEGDGERAAKAYKELWDGANQGILQMQAQELALKQLMIDDPIHSGYYAMQLVKVGVAWSDLKVKMGDATMFDVARSALGKLVADYQGVLPGITSAWGDFFTQFSDGVANSFGQAIVYSKDLGDAIGNVAREALASLISALVKLAIQWIVMKVLGNTIMGGNTAASAAAGAATAAAWAPAAAMVSLATFGANAGPAMAGIALTNALSLGFAAVGSAIGAAGAAGSVMAADGGYISGPGGPRDDLVRAWLSNGEFVINAAATSRFRPLLEAINSGKAPAFSPGFAGGGIVGTGTRGSWMGGADGASLKVVVENYNGSDVQVEQVSRDEVRVMVRDEVRRTAPQVVAGQIADPNSTVSKALANSTKTERRR